jgi:hypothetical protein
MKKAIKYFSVFATVLISSCDSDPECNPVLPPAPKCWEKFVGDYIVYDTVNNIDYTMNISHFATTNINGGVDDTLVLSNFGNKFDFKYHFTCGAEPNILLYNAPFPCFDHSNKRWSLTRANDDSATVKVENEILNDTLLLYFRIDNIAFYAADTVPYYSAYLKHIAVKQH